MTRDEIEQKIRLLHDLRKDNDADLIRTLFADDAVFGVAGCETSSGVACNLRGAAEYMPAIRALTSTFHWVDVDFHHIIVEGMQASANYTLTFDYAPSGERHQSDVTDIMTFRDGKIARMIQFADTAYLNLITEQGAIVQAKG